MFIGTPCQILSLRDLDCRWKHIHIQEGPRVPGLLNRVGLIFHFVRRFSPRPWYLTSSKRYGALLFIVASIKHFTMDGSHSQQCHSKKSTLTLSCLPQLVSRVTSHAHASPSHLHTFTQQRLRFCNAQTRSCFNGVHTAYLSHPDTS